MVAITQPHAWREAGGRPVQCQRPGQTTGRPGDRTNDPQTCQTAPMEDAAARVGRVTANGIELAYETFGDPSTPPVLLIMGLGTQMIAWPDELCEGLARCGLFVVRFDNRDVGGSKQLTNVPTPRPADILVLRR